MSTNIGDLTRLQLLNLIDDVYAGQFTDFDKEELIRYTRQHPSSRFEKLLTSRSVLAMIEKNRRDAQEAKKRAKQVVRPVRRVAGTAVKDPQYDIEVEFSEDGESFGNPLDVASNTVYQCRMRLRQHQTEFNATGFTLDWKKTSNLSWYDGYGTQTHEEAVSNPLVIARLVRTGSISSGSKMWVKVVVVERYM